LIKLFREEVCLHNDAAVQGQIVKNAGTVELESGWCNQDIKYY